MFLVYHLQLRQFPTQATRFNLTERELHALLEPWTRQQLVEVGERKWAPERARLTVLEGPKLEVQQLAMGRGWRAAERTSEDVTERVLAAIAAQASAARASAASVQGGPQPRESSQSPASPSGAPAMTYTQASPPPTPAAGGAAASDPLSLAVQLASLLGEDPERLLAAWRDVAARSSGLAPSESLALAERHVSKVDVE